MSNFVYLENTEYSVSETSGKALVAIVRTGDLSEATTLEYSTNSFTAVAGADYAEMSGFVSMAAGQSRIVVEIPILDDKLSEGTESFNFSLINASNSTILFPRTALVDIIDDESPSPTIFEPPPSSDYAVSFEPVLTNLSQPISIQFSEITPSIAYVALRAGVVEAVNTQTGQVVGTVFDISEKVNSAAADRGLLDIALHPDFANNPYLYAFYVVDPPDVTGKTGNAGPEGEGNRFAYVSRFTLDSSNGYLSIVPGSEVILAGGAGTSLNDISGGGELNFTESAHSSLPSSALIPGTAIFKDDYIKVDSLSHSGGALTFGPDGALYVGIGDGTSYNYADPRTVEVQSLDSLSGKILRIDPITGRGLADNPFVQPGDSLDGNRSKIYQLGLRNPFALTFDSNGKLFISDTGWFSYEEINSGAAGANFGWPYFEGGDNGLNVRTPRYSTFQSASEFYGRVENGSLTITAPYRAFSHTEDHPGYQVQAIVGSSSIYTGSVYPEAFAGDYFFTDVVQGEIYSVDSQNPTQIKYLTTLRTGFGPVNFTQGPDGYIYYVDFITGAIGRINITQFQNLDYDIVSQSQMLTGSKPNDTFVIDGLRNDYVITPLADNSGVVVSGGNWPDTLIGFEYIKFIDGVVSVGLEGKTIFGTDGADRILEGAGDQAPTRFADKISGRGGDDIIAGQFGDDSIWGDGGNDRLYGGRHDDSLFGGHGNDYLDGGLDNDFLDGGPGADVMIGGPGNDGYVVSQTGDRVVELAGQGIDTVQSSISYTLPGNVENGTAIGQMSMDLTGNSLDNNLTGNDANNIMRGLSGNDVISGGGGSDVIYGGEGRDILSGDAGQDTFVFLSVSESRGSFRTADIIADFASGIDKIDVSAIDANPREAGNQSFSFMGQHLFTGAAGQLRYAYNGTNAVVQADVDGDKIADLQITMFGVMPLKIGDFIL